MTPNQHPHDERLAALAGGDRDAVDDAVLRSHVADCARCRQVGEELAALRVALAQLPDLAPPRGFRAWDPRSAVPPVAAARSSVGARFAETMRRVLAPAMLAGASLAIVGAVGLSGFLEGTQGAGGAAGGAQEAVPGAGDFSSEPQRAAGEQPEDGAEGEGSGFEAASPGAAALGTPGEERTLAADDQELAYAGEPSPDRRLWAIMLSGGAVLLVVGFLLRRSLRPRPT